MAKMSYKYLFEAYRSNKCLLSGLITGYKFYPSEIITSVRQTILCAKMVDKYLISLRKVSEWMKYVISMYYRILSI